jgi:cyclase
MPSRRDFLKTSLLALAATSLPRYPAFGGARAGEFIELRRNVGIFTARGGTIGWLLDPQGIAVVDSQYPDTAEELLGILRQRGALDIDVLINTHHHGDHTAGNGVLGHAARSIVAHSRVPDLQRAAAEARGTLDDQTYADATFDSRWTLDIGDERVHALHYGPAHTGGDAVVVFERAEIVHMGDLVFNRAYPFIDLAGGASVPGWIETLEAVAAEHSNDALFVFGHARAPFEVTGTRDDVILQRDFLSAVWEAAQRAAAEGRSREEATALDSLPGFPEHGALSNWLNLGASLGAAYDEITGRP